MGVGGIKIESAAASEELTNDEYCAIYETGLKVAQEIMFG